MREGAVAGSAPARMKGVPWQRETGSCPKRGGTQSRGWGRRRMAAKMERNLEDKVTKSWPDTQHRPEPEQCRTSREESRLWAGSAGRGPRLLEAAQRPQPRTSALGLSPGPVSPAWQASAQGSLWASAPWVEPGAGRASPAVHSAFSSAREEAAGPGTRSPEVGSLAFLSPGAPSSAAPASSWNGRH